MRVATDIGGTFTDVVTLHHGDVRGWKVLSTPSAPGQAVTQVIQGLPVISSFSHGTTVATNALLERKGARVAFVTTEGFKDMLYLARQQRPRLYDFDCHRPEPLVPRSLCFEVPERLAPDGSVLKPLEKAQVELLADRVLQQKAQAVSVCLLFSFANPSHEILVEEVFQKRGLPVSRSSRIVPEFREYERASTTAMNAFVQPIVVSYVHRIRQALKEAGGPKDYFIMKSAGGVASSAEVFPVELLLSGPAGGVSGAILLGQEMGKPNLATFDMGGTSADFSAIVGGAPLWTDEGTIDGLPIRLPILDITSVGAGGGSIAWIDAGGALRVGPQSSGSDPGPACYGRGGVLATVTDANLLAGLLDPQAMSGCGFTLNRQRAEDAVSSLSGKAGMTIEETILGIRSVVHANMLRGVRRATVEKGVHVADCSLLAFGGAGPLHAAELAAELGIRSVLVPPMAGMFSALGILLADVRLDLGASLLLPWDPAAAAVLNHAVRRFEEQARRSFVRQGVDPDKARFIPSVDMRYQGQSFHLSVPYDGTENLPAVFERVFETRYGYRLGTTDPVEVVSVRLSAVVPQEKVALPGTTQTIPCKPASHRKVLTPFGPKPAPVYHRSGLWESFSGQGPVIIEDNGTTVYVPPGCAVSVEANGCIKIEVNLPDRKPEHSGVSS